MYEFKVTVEIPGLPEAINALADALAANKTNIICNQTGENNQTIGNTGVVNISHGAKKPTPETVNPPAVKEAPAAEPTVAEPASVSQEKRYTVDDLSRAGAALIDQGKMPQLIELLKKYGVQAVTQLDASTYPAFVEEMKALGAQL